MVDPYDPEEMLVCPYDPVHVIRRKRMQYHLIKCRKCKNLNNDPYDPYAHLFCVCSSYTTRNELLLKVIHQNYNTSDFTVCPFNANHVVPKLERNFHIETCQYKERVEALLLHDSSKYKQKGDTSIPEADWTPPEPEESWDNDNVQFVPSQHDELFEAKVVPTKQSGALCSVKKPEASKPKKTPTEPPPSVRMPKPSTESTVYNYSMGIKPDSGTKAAGRGRGVSVARGSGLPNGHSAPPGFGRGRGVKRQLQDTTPTPSGLSQQPVSLQKPPPSGPPPPGPSGPPPPGLLPPGLPPPQSLPQQINYESMPPLEDATDLIEEEVTTAKKKVRKLTKMLKQIINIEEKRDKKVALEPEQIAKLRRKDDVIISLQMAQDELAAALEKQKLHSV